MKAELKNKLNEMVQRMMRDFRKKYPNASTLPRDGEVLREWVEAGWLGYLKALTKEETEELAAYLLADETMDSLIKLMMLSIMGGDGRKQ